MRGVAAIEGVDVSRLELTVATAYYDHLADLIHGKVPVEGVDLNWLTFKVEEIFFRFLVHREFDVSEVSLAKYASMISQGDRSLTPFRYFPSRVPRHSSIYVRADGPVKGPGGLEWTPHRPAGMGADRGSLFARPAERINTASTCRRSRGCRPGSIRQAVSRR